jgi:hypothetical protein
MTSVKFQVEELAQKLKKLEHKVKKIGAEERPKREPSQYNLYVAEEIKKIKKGTPQEKFREAVQHYHEHMEGKGKRMIHKKEERKEERKTRKTDVGKRRFKRDEEEFEDMD